MSILADTGEKFLRQVKHQDTALYDLIMARLNNSGAVNNLAGLGQEAENGIFSTTGEFLKSTGVGIWEGIKGGIADYGRIYIENKAKAEAWEGQAEILLEKAKFEAEQARMQAATEQIRLLAEREQVEIQQELQGFKTKKIMQTGLLAAVLFGGFILAQNAGMFR